MALKKRRQGYCCDKTVRIDDARKANVARGGGDGEEATALAGGESEVAALTSRRLAHGYGANFIPPTFTSSTRPGIHNAHIHIVQEACRRDIWALYCKRSPRYIKNGRGSTSAVS